MKFIKFFIVIFISLASSVKADLNKDLFNQLKEGGKLIFIRHAYAPGSGDPDNFNLNDCTTQRNLSEEGKKQAEYIGKFFRDKKIILDVVYTAKMVMGIYDLIKKKYFKNGSRILIVHTGGVQGNRGMNKRFNLNLPHNF